MKRMTRWMGSMAVVLAAGLAAGAAAEEITLEQAEKAVGNWIARGGAFGKLSGGLELSGETFEDPDTGAKMHVVSVPGKGFAVTSADDGIEPVVLFSDGDGEFAAEAGSPLWDLLRWDLSARQRGGKTAALRKSGSGDSAAASARAKWAELLTEGGEGWRETLRAANGKRTISEIRRVLPMRTLWNQRDNSRGEQAYNLYSPRKPGTVEAAEAAAAARGGRGEADSGEGEGEQAPCGCVATAGGQIMKFLKWPAGAVEARQGNCEVWGIPVTLTMTGGVYRWEGMGTVEPTGAECEEVSKLTYDIGVACGASFSNETSMSAEVLVGKMTGVFRYENAAWLTFESFDPSSFEQGVTTSLDAGVPLLVSLRRSATAKGGHAVVVDGCGNDGGAFAVHINCGWGSGSYNLWYMPPSIHPADGYEYDFIAGFGYNFFAADTGSVISGIVKGPNGRAVTGASVSCSGPAGVQGWSNKAKGVAGCYVLCAPPGSYTVSARANGAQSSEYSVEPKACTRGVMGNVLQDIVIPGVKTVAAVAAATAGAGGSAKAARGAGDAAFAAPFEVSLSSATPGAEIRYTLDGTQPGPESALCEGAIAIQDTTTLRAVAYADGMECSEEFRRTWTFEDPQSRDDFADARPVSGASGRSEFNNAGYTKESGEPVHSDGNYPGGASAWAKWTAPADGDWTFWLEGTGTNGTSELDTQLAIYTGDEVGGLSLTAANDDSPSGEGYSSRLSFRAEGGTEYKIAMDTYGGAEGTLRLRWEEGYLHWVTPDYTSRFVPCSGGRHGFRVRSSAGWHVVEYTAPVEPKTMEGGSGEDFVFEMPENGTGAERTGSVTFQSANSERVSVAFIQHPSLDFATEREEALERAWRENKRILLVHGREGCGYTRGTLFSMLPSAAVKPLLDEGYVVWFNNCDVQASEAYAYTSGLGRYNLPLIAIIDPQVPSTWVDRTTRPQSAADLLALLDAHADWGGILQVATETLPAAAAGEAYGAALEATGGTLPYAWGLKGDYTETAVPGSFAETGTAQGWRDDDACWDLPLPFAFPFYGGSYTNAKINSNGAISFGKAGFTAYSYGESTFLGAPIVAVLWRDLLTTGGDIYVESGTDAVTVRWAGTSYAGGGAVNFAATLHRDGRIVLSYGPGNASGGFIGISAGDGMTALVSAKGNAGSMADADDIVFGIPSVLPPGLSLSAEGQLGGTPEVAGIHAFTVTVTDARGVTTSKELSLAVEDYGGGASTADTPVPVPHAWLAGYGLGDGTAEGFEGAAAAVAANGMPVWACYVAGLSPADPGARFTARISLADGKPVLESVSPDLGVGRNYTLVGKKDLMPGEWADLTGISSPAADGYHFFGAAVSLPE